MSGDTGAIEGQVWLVGDRVFVQLERWLEHSPETVWRMLTDSGHLAQWLAPGSLEAREGGRVQLDFGNSGMPIDSTVVACRPGELLSYSWSSGDRPERPLSWALMPTETSTRLRLTLSLPENDLVPIACAGWDTHLEMLVAALEGISIHFPAERFRAARVYFEQLREEARSV
ncbi:SRPBCC family protein [Marinobacter daepoensis]|uniref:SRPBCC family protein n=1 Tax=Marinobacter daepoensis TaxID=262077 RepID=UPI001C9671A5|nr:SRPBCC family protein [Marinobacter daepoensis]MBY6033150.1 SRPBCC family protein [Marinobacter daepoensis]